MKRYPLYSEGLEHDSCGVGAVVNLNGQAEHRVVCDALTIVERLAHRAGCDALGTTGDGVGILTQLPHGLFAQWAAENGVTLGEPMDYGVAMAFLPQQNEDARHALELSAAAHGLRVIGWRDVPCDPSILGAGALASMPVVRQCFLARPADVQRGAAFDRRLYLVRRMFEKSCADAYICSLSSRTVVYKGMMLVSQLRSFYHDLRSPLYASALAMVHSRFSTNTFPSWDKAQPHRMLLHNGEINTIRGNADRMLAREECMLSPVMGRELREAFPIVDPNGSDSMMLDNSMEFMALNDMPLPLAGMVLLPEPWQQSKKITPWRDMYRYYSTMMEPWDGPAALLYSDGDCVCASLDRNGLRPLRCALTSDGRLILSSEAGVLYEQEAFITKRWRLRAGDVLMADLRAGELVEGDALKARLAARHPYDRWVRDGVCGLSDLADVGQAQPAMEEARRIKLCQAFGYTNEDITGVLLPMARTGKEPIASMGADEPLAALSQAHPCLSSYFKQRFAQVTNPPIDALREALKTDCSVYLGGEGNPLIAGEENCRVLELDSPVITGAELSRIRANRTREFRTKMISLLYDEGGTLKDALDALFAACDRAYVESCPVVILSDRGADERHCAIPSLLAVSALEQHLVQAKRRTRVSVILESAEPRDAHHLALLIAYGARAVNPYLAQECVAAMAREGRVDASADEAVAAYNKALTDGVLHIASKMGVSTLQAYQSAQLFESIGLDAELVDRYFTNTPHRLGGVGLERIESDLRWYHARAFAQDTDDTLDSVGVHRLRTGEGCEKHLYTPEVIHTLQQAVWQNDESLFNRYSELVYKTGAPTLRSLLDFRFDQRAAVPLDEVEPEESIVRRFKTGAMSYGSLSQEAHECLALAMNRLGARSNTGEGGELPERFGTELNSAIKQVASGRFGVTEQYLLSANEIQIKVAQGAKPGEGGHLPGAKVTPQVARTRCATPGLSLISPPPHHDVYSIEDMAQLIYDLKCANRDARISVKLVSEAGVGTVASGVAKAGAQVVVVSGGEGGTGAAPLTSIHGAGLPWELGVAEAHQTLCRNGLRQRVALETDGKLMTGRDVAVAALLGAEEFSFATAPLITMGCRMMRVCNLDTCPYGIATQRPELRKRFVGKPEYVERFMLFVARELRGIMAGLGFRTVDEMVGHADLLREREQSPLDLSELTAFSQNDHYEAAVDFHLDERADAGSLGQTVTLRNTDRSFGTLLGAALYRKHNGAIPAQTVAACGCGGQSFGAFLPKGLTLCLTGVANDYLGKGLSGGVIAVRPPDDGRLSPDDALIGNVALYGATSGGAYIAGTAGERFCVRNSGAVAVAQGVGDHGCEYMTGGRAVILGSIGENFAAGMSGGIAYVLDERGDARRHINGAMVEIRPLEDDKLRRELLEILETHLLETGSPKARAILDEPEKWLSRFIAVIPREYLRMLEGR